MDKVNLPWERVEMSYQPYPYDNGAVNLRLKIYF